MPQKRRPARLWLRPDTGTWFIKDGTKRISTECSEAEVAAAQNFLAIYLADQYRPERGGSASKVTIGDVLMVYLDEKAGKTARPKETEAMIGRLNDFFGGYKVADIRGKLCREFADDRGNEGGARRDLEVLRAAVNYYHAEHTLDMVPKISLPVKGSPRERWLTRKEVASLLRAARRADKCDHLVRLILIGLYTGTRLSAILGLQWMANTTGGWIDLDKGVIYRKAEGERVAHNKRKTPVKIPPRLMTFLRYWKKADTAIDEQGREVCLRHVVHYGGEKIVKPHKAFRTIRNAAELGEDVTPHILRHTRATWLAQAGVDAHEAAASLGLTVEEFERTYSHSSPDFQKSAANAF
jgi:integrase